MWTFAYHGFQHEGYSCHIYNIITCERLGPKYPAIGIRIDGIFITNTMDGLPDVGAGGEDDSGQDEDGHRCRPMKPKTGVVNDNLGFVEKTQELLIVNILPHGHVAVLVLIWQAVVGIA